MVKIIYRSEIRKMAECSKQSGYLQSN